MPANCRGISKVQKGMKNTLSTKHATMQLTEEETYEAFSAVMRLRKIEAVHLEDCKNPDYNPETRVMTIRTGGVVNSNK